jgi:cell volume regulation protein A
VNPVALFLVTIASIFMIGTLGEIVFRRTQVPDVVWLLLAGIVLGPVSGVVTRDQLAVIAPYFGALTLVVVLFDGGSRLKLREISRTAPRAGLLALLTFAFSTAALALASMGARSVGWFPPEWSWAHAVLFGAILGGSSSIIILPAMTLAGVRDAVANVVNLESAFTDALCVVGATAMIDVILHGGGAGEGPWSALGRSFGLGAAIGLVAGFVWLNFLRLIRASDYAYPITLSALLLLYVLIDGIGGSAALGILVFAIVVGNAGTFGTAFRMSDTLDLGEGVRGFHRQVTFIVKSFFFTFIGAMLGPPWSLVALGLLFGLVLLAARVPPVRLALLGSGFAAGERRLVTVAMPRGLAAGVLASMPAAAGVAGTADLPIVVFAAVLASILIFAIGLPVIRRAGGGPAPAPAAVGGTAPVAGTPPVAGGAEESSA